MAGRRRRKARLLPRLFPVMVVIGFMVIFGAVGFGLWKVWPTVREHARTALSKVADSTNRNKPQAKKTPRDRGPKRPAVSASSRTAETRLKRRNEELRKEVARLRGELERTSETLARKEQELNEVKLQLLIHEKKRGQ